MRSGGGSGEDGVGGDYGNSSSLAINSGIIKGGIRSTVKSEIEGACINIINKDRGLHLAVKILRLVG